MTLQSNLLSGDRALEACSISDSAHVTKGAVGDHVSKIQAALIILDGARISPDELAATKYGLSTAAAVLSFKKKRNIINRSYQNQADDIVGKMTIAALDREMLSKQAPPVDAGVAVCKFTDVRPYRSGGLMLAFSVPASPAPVLSAPTPLKHAMDVMGLARIWANNALVWLRTVRGVYRQHGNSNWPPSALALFEAVDAHFHLRRLPRVEDQPHFLDQIITNYVNILALLNNPDAMGDDPNAYTDPEDPRFGAYATAKIGGFHDASVSKKVWFHGLFLSVTGQKARIAMILHECGHSVASGLHYAYGHPRSSGGTAGEPFRGAKHPRNYENLTPDEALCNADTYATFAAHASTGNAGPDGDIRPGAHDIKS
jgi:hypothetical protein